MTPTTEVLRAMIRGYEAQAEFLRLHGKDNDPDEVRELAALKSALADVERMDYLRTRAYKEGHDGGWWGSFHFYPIMAWEDAPTKGKPYRHESLNAAIDQARTAQDGGQGVGK